MEEVQARGWRLHILECLIWWVDEGILSYPGCQDGRKECFEDPSYQYCLGGGEWKDKAQECESGPGHFLRSPGFWGQDEMVER
jgi:hypothetical protein